VVAFIIPGKGQALDAAGLKTFLKARLSSFKIPKEYIFVAELPKSAQGKILRKEARKLYSE
jgi:long-chain acyl-CoA synthetase